MLVQERKRHCECVCVHVCDEPWRWTGPTEAVQRIHSLICFFFSYWQPGWAWTSSLLVQPLTTDLIRFHVSRDSEGTRSFPQLLEPDVGFYLSFLQGKCFVKTCFSHGNAKKKYFLGKPGMNGFVLLTTGNLGLLFILSCELIYHLCILQNL